MQSQSEPNAGFGWSVQFRYWKNTIDRRYYSVCGVPELMIDFGLKSLAVVDDFGNLVGVSK